MTPAEKSFRTHRIFAANICRSNHIEGTLGRNVFAPDFLYRWLTVILPRLVQGRLAGFDFRPRTGGVSCDMNQLKLSADRLSWLKPSDLITATFAWRNFRQAF